LIFKRADFGQSLSAYGVLSSLAVLQAPVLMARYRSDLMFRYTFAQMLVMPVAFWAGSAWFGATGVALAWVLIYPIGLAWLMRQVLRGKFSLTAGKRESIKIILRIFQYVSEARWATYLHLMSNYVAGTRSVLD
jgi:hypothetical protein